MRTAPVATGARPIVLAACALLLAARTPTSQDLPRGTIIESVTVEADSAQSYAVYLPSDYSPDRAWSLLLAFHPSARGVAFVETYRSGAERYGYIVAGSNNSRNGSWDEITRAVRAMSRDVGRRFAVDAERIYLTGHSGGARVAMEVALGANNIAGVVASSAGFPDARPRTSVRFPVFATAGIDDFNYLEMKRLDARLTSAHHLAVFEGGHTLPPEAVATEAIAWLELQAMRGGRRAKDPALIDALFAARQRRIDDTSQPSDRLHLLRATVADFTGLRDVTAMKTVADTLAKDPAVKKALAEEQRALDAEARLLDQALAAEARLRNAEARPAALDELRRLLETWSRAAGVSQPSPERSRSRRLLGALAAGAAERVQDEEYRALVRRYRWR